MNLVMNLISNYSEIITINFLFSYDIPVLSSLSQPTNWPTAGGLLMTLTGNNFGNTSIKTQFVVSNLTSNSYVPSNSIDFLMYTDTTIVFHTFAPSLNFDPEYFQHFLFISVAGQLSTSSILYTYCAPILASSNITSGSTLGGYGIRLFVFNF